MDKYKRFVFFASVEPNIAPNYKEIKDYFNDCKDYKAKIAVSHIKYHLLLWTYLLAKSIHIELGTEIKLSDLPEIDAVLKTIYKYLYDFDIKNIDNIINTFEKYNISRINTIMNILYIISENPKSKFDNNREIYLAYMMYPECRNFILKNLHNNEPKRDIAFQFYALFNKQYQYNLVNPTFNLFAKNDMLINENFNALLEHKSVYLTLMSNFLVPFNKSVLAEQNGIMYDLEIVPRSLPANAFWFFQICKKINYKPAKFPYPQIMKMILRYMFI